ncbi:MAG: hypothetical protein MHM6MM_005542 [Cercozoa sp. M6MM]
MNTLVAAVNAGDACRSVGDTCRTIGVCLRAQQGACYVLDPDGTSVALAPSTKIVSQEELAMTAGLVELPPIDMLTDAQLDAIIDRIQEELDEGGSGGIVLDFIGGTANASAALVLVLPDNASMLPAETKMVENSDTIQAILTAVGGAASSGNVNMNAQGEGGTVMLSVSTLEGTVAGSLSADVPVPICNTLADEEGQLSDTMMRHCVAPASLRPLPVGRECACDVECDDLAGAHCIEGEMKCLKIKDAACSAVSRVQWARDALAVERAAPA